MAKTKEQLQKEADAEIEAAKPQYVVTADAKTGESVRRERTEDEYAKAKIELGNSKWEEQQFGYIEKRQRAYPSLTDFVEAYTENEIGGDDTKW